MNKLKATKSSFGSVYFHLSLIVIGVTVGFYFLSKFYIEPQLVETKAQSVLSLIRSHNEDIFLNKTRALRDELIQSEIIKDDKLFHHFFLEEKSTVEGFLKNCQFYSPSICLGKNVSVFLEANSRLLPSEQFKFAVVLDADLTSPPAFFYLMQIGAISAICIAFFLLFRSIAKKEDYLLNRLSVASVAFSRTKKLLSNQDSTDEFDSFGRSAEELVADLEEYKEKFERKTRLEQLGLVVGQVSHDLKAPFNEAENFLKALPNLMNEIPREDLLTAINSLVKRIQGGKASLNQALQFTKQVNIAREELSLGEIFNSVSSRVKENKKLDDIAINFNGNLHYRTLGDRLKLETAFLNLLENTADEKRNASVEMVLSVNDLGVAKILYTDNGGGIPDEYLDKIFEPLVTFKQSGTGFGLSSTKEIFSQHGGRIRALPHTGGARFEILLPILGGANA